MNGFHWINHHDLRHLRVKFECVETIDYCDILFLIFYQIVVNSSTPNLIKKKKKKKKKKTHQTWYAV